MSDTSSGHPLHLSRLDAGWREHCLDRLCSRRSQAVAKRQDPAHEARRNLTPPDTPGRLTGMFSPHPWATWPTRRLWQALLPFGIIVVIIIVLFLQWDPMLRHRDAPYGIFSLELAGTVAGTKAIIEPWSESVRSVAMRITLVDYLFMIAYGTGLVLLCLLMGRWTKQRGRGNPLFWQRAAWLPWIAAGCDAIENTASLFLMTGSIVAPWPQIMTTAAVIKFILLLFVICVLALGAFGLALLRPRRT